MRNLIIIVALLITSYSFGQIHNLKAVGLDTLTTTERNALTVPTDRTYMIWNETTEQIEYNPKNTGWLAITAGGLTSGDIDTYAELNPIVADVTLTHNGLFDTFSELNAIVADKSLVNLEDANAFTNTGNSFTGGLKIIGIVSNELGILNFIDPTDGISINGQLSYSKGHTLPGFGLKNSNAGAADWLILKDAGGADYDGVFTVNSLVKDGATADDVLLGNGTTTSLATIGTDDQTAAEVTFTPAGGVAATNVQAAIAEVDAEHTVDTNTNIGNANLSTPAATTRTLTITDVFKLADSGGYQHLRINASGGAGVGTSILGHNWNIEDNNGGGAIGSDASTWGFNFLTGGIKNLIFTPTDVTYGGTTLLGGGGIAGTIPGRTGTDITAGMIQTQAQYDADGAPSTGQFVLISDAKPAKVVTTATIAMDGWKMYDDQTADAATITLSDCQAGETLTVYINRASAPTLAGTGLTFNQLPNTTAFAAATEMAIYFEVSFNGTTIDYYYFER